MSPEVTALWVTVGVMGVGTILQWIQAHRDKDREEAHRRDEASEVARWKENVIGRIGQLEGFKDDTRTKHGDIYNLLGQINTRLSRIEGALPGWKAPPEGE